MKSRNILVIGGTLVLATAAYVWFFIYNKAHTDYSAEETSFNGAAVALHDSLSANQEKFKTTYINTAVILEGIVTESGAHSFVLDDVFICALDSTFMDQIPEPGETIKTKGRVVGVEDDILGNLICRIDKCVILKD